MAIRYDDKLKDEIRRIVKNYQAKRQRVLNKGGNVIPDPAYVSSFLNDYTNRKTLLRDLKQLQRYSKKGAEEELATEFGEVKTRYEIDELKRLATQGKKNIARQLNQAGDIYRMQPITRSNYEHLKLRYEYLSKPILKLSRRQYQTFERIAHGEGELEKKRQTYYDNIMYMVDYIAYGLPQTTIDNLKTALSKLSMAKLTDMVESDPYVSSIVNYYEVIKGGGTLDTVNTDGSVITFQQKVEDLIVYINAL